MVTTVFDLAGALLIVLAVAVLVWPLSPAGAFAAAGVGIGDGQLEETRFIDRQLDGPATLGRDRRDAIDGLRDAIDPSSRKPKRGRRR